MLRMTTTETATVWLSAVHPRLTPFTATVLPIDSRLSDIWPSEQRLAHFASPEVTSIGGPYNVFLRVTQTRDAHLSALFMGSPVDASLIL